MRRGALQTRLRRASRRAYGACWGLEGRKRRAVHRVCRRLNLFYSCCVDGRSRSLRMVAPEAVLEGHCRLRARYAQSALALFFTLRPQTLRKLPGHKLPRARSRQSTAGVPPAICGSAPRLWLRQRRAFTLAPLCAWCPLDRQGCRSFNPKFHSLLFASSSLSRRKARINRGPRCCPRRW